MASGMPFFFPVTMPFNFLLIVVYQLFLEDSFLKAVRSLALADLAVVDDKASKMFFLLLEGGGMAILESSKIIDNIVLPEVL